MFVCFPLQLKRDNIEERESKKVTQVRHAHTHKGGLGGVHGFLLSILCCLFVRKGTHIFLFYGKIHIYTHSSHPCDKDKNGCERMGNISNAIAHVTCMTFFKVFLNK